MAIFNCSLELFDFTLPIEVSLWLRLVLLGDGVSDLLSPTRNDTSSTLASVAASCDFLPLLDFFLGEEGTELSNVTERRIPGSLSLLALATSTALDCFEIEVWLSSA